MDHRTSMLDVEVIEWCLQEVCIIGESSSNCQASSTGGSVHCSCLNGGTAKG